MGDSTTWTTSGCWGDPGTTQNWRDRRAQLCGRDNKIVEHNAELPGRAVEEIVRWHNRFDSETPRASGRMFCPSNTSRASSFGVGSKTGGMTLEGTPRLHRRTASHTIALHNDAYRRHLNRPEQARHTSSSDRKPNERRSAQLNRRSKISPRTSGARAQFESQKARRSGKVKIACEPAVIKLNACATAP